MVDPRIRNKEIKQDILSNIINNPDRFNALISILARKDILSAKDLDLIYGDDI